MATIIKTDGAQIEVQPKNGTDFQLEELNEIVGGFIEIVYLRNGLIMVVNEEGKLNNLPLNEVATRVCLLNGYPDTIVGNVLVCKSEEVK